MQEVATGPPILEPVRSRSATSAAVSTAGCAGERTALRPPAAYASDTHSQFGEDGIIVDLLRRIEPLVTRPEDRRWVVEFGAWDGLRYSNTRRLIEAGATSAVLIEADRDRHRTLVANTRAFDGVHALHAAVGWGPEDGLDTLLARTPCPDVLDVLSIDIDGNDYHVWRALERYRPRIVVIEFNPTIPTDAWYVQPADPNVRTGSSLLALDGLARKKGYELAAVTAANAIFVEKTLFPAIGLEDNRPSSLRAEDSAPLTWLCHGFDGTCFLVGSKHMIWHDVPMTDARVQQLPRSARRHPDTLSKAGRAMLSLVRRLRRTPREDQP